MCRLAEVKVGVQRRDHCRKCAHWSHDRKANAASWSTDAALPKASRRERDKLAIVMHMHVYAWTQVDAPDVTVT